MQHHKVVIEDQHFKEEFSNVKGLENRLTEANTWNRIVNRKIKHRLLDPGLVKTDKDGVTRHS